MQGIVCTLCMPLHAADAPLGNNIALLALLRSLRSLQVLLSAPNKNKTNRNCSVRFFISWFATGLVTMRRIVCTLRVPLHAVQLTASEERSKRLHLRKSSAADIANDCAIHRANA